MTTWTKITATVMAGCFSALIATSIANAAEITVVAGLGPLPDVMGTLVPMFDFFVGW